MRDFPRKSQLNLYHYGESKVKKVLFISLLALLIVLGAVLSVYYAVLFAGNTAYTMNLILALICAAEAVTTSIALYLYVKNSTFKYIKVINGVAFLLCLQVGLFAFMWILYFLGIQAE